MTTTSAPRGAAALRSDDPAPRPDVSPATRKLGGLAGWLDDRTGVAKPGGYLLKKVFPDHWSFMLGEIAMYSMIICLLTGVFLTFWFVPSMNEIPYHGSYIPMQGQVMSEAYATTLNISFDIRGGLLIRQIHHWAALMFIVAIMVHMFRVFFTGAFRKPREINWVIGSILSMLALVEGFAGYSLPDDLLSGTGIRAAEGFMQSIPIVGSYVAYFLFDGAFPGTAIIPRFYTAHILILPALLIGLFTAHILLVFFHKHTQFPGPGRTNDNVVGYPLMPVYMAKAGGFFFIVFGVIALIAALVTINPIWAYGPYNPTMVTAGSQPDWYMLFADGGLRLLPGWLEIYPFGYTLSLNVAIGALGIIPVMYTLIGVYPFLEAWVTGDKREHHLLDRPRNAPVRTALGAAFITDYVILALAGVNDIMAIKLNLSINDITNFFRVAFFVLPVIVFWVTKRVCLSLQRADRNLVLHGRETGNIYRSAEGAFSELHEPLDEYTRWRLVQHEVPEPIAIAAATDANGVANTAAKGERRRARWSQFYFRDRVAPVSPTELAAAHHHGEHDAISGAGEPSALTAGGAADAESPSPTGSTEG